MINPEMDYQEYIAHLEAENEKLRDKLGTEMASHAFMSRGMEALRDILKVATCPECGGSGASYDEYGNPCQCRWCHERENLLNG